MGVLQKQKTLAGIHLFTINAFVYIASVFYTPFISAYYACNGISAAQIGVLLTIGPIVTILIQPLWAKLSDRTQKRKQVLLLVAAGSGLSMFLYYLGGSFWGFLFTTICVTSFTTAVIPLCDAIVIHLANSKGIRFSVLRMGGTIGYALMAVFAGIFIRQHPSSQFWLSFLGYTVLFAFICGLPGGKPQESKPEAVLKHTHGGPGKIFTSYLIYFVLAFACISQLGLSFYSGFIGPYILKKGYSQSVIGIMNCISAMSELPVLFLIDRLIAKVGTMKILFLSCILMGIRIALPIGNGLVWVVLAQLLQGVTYMTVYFSCVQFVSRYARNGYQSRGQSLLFTIQSGFGAILGSLSGGILVEKFGYRNAFLTMMVFIFVCAGATAVLYIYKSKKRRQSEGNQRSEVSIDEV
jgi:MFS family permease